MNEKNIENKTLASEVRAPLLRPQLDPQEARKDLESQGLEAFKAYIRSGDDTVLHNLHKKSLSTANHEDGGYTVPTEIGERMSRELAELSPIRNLANIMEISTEAIDFLMDTHEADAGWVAETAARAETETPQFKKKRIHVHEMYASPRATQKLLDDAQIDIESWIINRVSQKMASMESEAFIHGNGVNCPRGLLSYSLTTDRGEDEEKIQHLITGKDGDFKDENAADILIDTVNQLRSQDLPGASWLMSRSAYARIRKLKDENGNYLWMPGLDGGHQGTLFGYPVHICDALPELVPGEASTPIIFGNFRKAYQIVDRNKERLSVLRDEFTHKPFIEFYVTSRVGGDIVDFEALKCITFKTAQNQVTQDQSDG